MTFRRRALWTMILMTALAGAASSVFAGEPVSGGEADGMSWRWIMASGGFLMHVLGAMSVLTLALVIYFLAVLRMEQVLPRDLYRELLRRLRAGEMDEARRSCKDHACPLSSVTMAAMDYAGSVSVPDPVLLKDVMESEGSRQAEVIQGQTQYLLDVAVVAPMVGLLGTVFGMLRAFSSIALDMANAKPVVLAEGVSQALVTTASGLIVGIPAMIFYALFRRRAAKLVANLESASARVLAAMAGTAKQ